ATGVVAAAGGCATAAGTPSFEDVATRWAELLQVAGRSRLLGAALARARLVAVTGDAVVVAVPDGDPVGRDTLRRREAAESFREAAREIFGVPLRIVVEGGARPGAAPTTSGASAASTARPAAPPAARPAATPPPAVRPAPPSPRAGGTLDEVRANPQVKALLDTFGARVLAVQPVDEPARREGESA
ncbi:MAG TPA: hypothetical protein VND21_08410, partial [Planctomycetota bacterium]|nr:hypothetical protein [Planctomycetota bacterium]